jgi:hypothetical protein
MKNGIYNVSSTVMIQNHATKIQGESVEHTILTIAAVEENQLDDENVFENNTVYSDFIGDGISFSLQKNGEVRYNNVFGSSISFYMCRYSQVLGNLIQDSPLSGISYSLPAYNNRIERNIILRSINSGIRVSCNLEHPISLGSRYHGLEIMYNIILDTRFLALNWISSLTVLT